MGYNAVDQRKTARDILHASWNRHYNIWHALFAGHQHWWDKIGCQQNSNFWKESCQAQTWTTHFTDGDVNHYAISFSPSVETGRVCHWYAISQLYTHTSNDYIQYIECLFSYCYIKKYSCISSFTSRYSPYLDVQIYPRFPFSQV